MAVTKKDKLRFALQKARLAGGAAGAVVGFVKDEMRRGTLLKNLLNLRTGGIEDISWAQLLEERASQIPNKTFLLYKNESYTYRQMDENANRVARFLLEMGLGPGKGVGIFMKNSPRFLDIFFAVQKIGGYVVPINSELRGDGLGYILNHSDIEALAIDAELLEAFDNIPEQPKKLASLIVDDIEEEALGIKIPKKAKRLSKAYALAPKKPDITPNSDDMILIMYTSGTTGRPKGVVYTYNRSRVKLLGIVGGMTLRKNDVYYTALALCHGNAMFLTVTLSMAVGATVALSRKFTASGFWDDIRRYNVTVFNTIGSIIPILMKQPERPNDTDNKVRYVLSAACPADMWQPFERRFGVTLYEGYGAVDSGGKGVINLGTAPVGSLGKPIAGAKDCKVVDENNNPVPPGVPGELIFRVGDKKGGVSYYKNEQATNKKMRNGWMYTGDIVRADEDGYLYFVGRDSDSMRKGGENVSAYEVEHVITQHPAVEDVAVYAVPSELAEDEIMASIKLVPGKTATAQEIRDFLKNKLAKFAIPRYIRFVDEFPMTQTHRIIKKQLVEIGVTKDTFDSKG
ncbi:MAG: AMP-binding protein [Desulfatibacillaceae bacterium]|nr:AMP-binding protein [Desulfatibacillaceae bacterium]